MSAPDAEPTLHDRNTTSKAQLMSWIRRFNVSFIRILSRDFTELARGRCACAKRGVQSRPIRTRPIRHQNECLPPNTQPTVRHHRGAVYHWPYSLWRGILALLEAPITNTGADICCYHVLGKLQCFLTCHRSCFKTSYLSSVTGESWSPGFAYVLLPVSREANLTSTHIDDWTIRNIFLLKFPVDAAITGCNDVSVYQ